MKKVNVKKNGKKINKAIAKIVHKTAETGAGLPSILGWHQPKVPKKLSK